MTSIYVSFFATSNCMILMDIEKMGITDRETDQPTYCRYPKTTVRMTMTRINTWVAFFCFSIERLATAPNACTLC
jgi:hypothetical protein